MVMSPPPGSPPSSPSPPLARLAKAIRTPADTRPVRYPGSRSAMPEIPDPALPHAPAPKPVATAAPPPPNPAARAPDASQTVQPVTVKLAPVGKTERTVTVPANLASEHYEALHRMINKMGAEVGAERGRVEGGTAGRNVAGRTLSREPSGMLHRHGTGF